MQTRAGRPPLRTLLSMMAEARELEVRSRDVEKQPTALSRTVPLVERNSRASHFQAGKRLEKSRITAISREGQSERWDAIGPEQ